MFFRKVCAIFIFFLLITLNARAELRRCGERIVNLERLFNLRHGLTMGDDTIPSRRVSEDETESEAVQRDINRMLDEYYELRGWTRDGFPQSEALKRLGIQRDVVGRYTSVRGAK